MAARDGCRNSATLPIFGGFNVGAYDKSKDLVIDPLVFGTYYGGDQGWDAPR